MRILPILLVLMVLLAAPAMAARTAINQYNQTYTDYDAVAVANPWTTFDASNDMYVWSVDESQQYFVVNTTTTASAYDTLFEVQSGPFIQGAKGDLSISLDTNKTYVLGPFETSRFKQANGKIYIDLNSTRGTVFCIGTA